LSFEGAYGKVWKVTHKTSKIIRAMKSLKKSSILKEEQERLFSEMNLLKNLDHPHIVKLFELY
jgi:calcium-dependent protein kinase